MATNDRGQYRVWFVRVLNGPSFRALQADARSILWPLKLRLPPFGIAPFPGAAGVLSDDTAIPYDRCGVALGELEERGWIEREENVLWLVRGLEFEPHLNPRDRNHRKYLTAVIDALPSLGIVKRFQARYHNWFPDLHLGESSLGPSLDPSRGPSGESSESPPEPYSMKHKAGSHPSRSQQGGARKASQDPSEEPSDAEPSGSAVVVHSGGNGVGRTRGYEAAVERGRLALAHLAELSQSEAKVEDLREQMISLGFAYWALVLKHPDALQDPKREQVLRARLRENRNNISEILYVADGAKRDPSTMGQNARNRKFDGIETIYRDRAQVERYAELGGYKKDPSGAYPMHPMIKKMTNGEAH